MTENQITDWENLIKRSSEQDLLKWLPDISDMARPSHPSSGQYTYLLGVIALRLSEIDKMSVKI